MAKSQKYTGPTTFVDIDNSRMPEQVSVMEQIIEDGGCPFCMENFQKYHEQEVMKEGQFWLITPNRWPYENTKLHLLAVLKIHAENLQELPAGAGEELIALFKWVEQNYELPGGGWAMRFGDTNYSAGTIKHLHAQFIVPDITKDGFKPVRFKIGKG
jgi:diadenosine tetraphosphate (Ap4A) HIT family hydrolase